MIRPRECAPTLMKLRCSDGSITATGVNLREPCPKEHQGQALLGEWVIAIPSYTRISFSIGRRWGCSGFSVGVVCCVRRIESGVCVKGAQQVGRFTGCRAEILV